MHVGVMDWGFTVPITIPLVRFYTCNKLRTTEWICIKFNAAVDTLNPSGDYL